MNWDFLWTRKQRFMNMLSNQGNKILYVEPTYSLMEKARKRFYVKPTMKSRVRVINDNLIILTPPLLFPFGRFKAIRSFNYARIVSAITRYQKHFKLSRPILWMYPPWAVELIGRLGEKLTVYDCVDEHSAYPEVDKKLVQEQENSLVSSADVVFVTARGLIEKRKKINPNTFFIPNGVDFEHFSKAQNAELEIPQDIKKIRRPLVGFVGGIAPWIDLDLIYGIAKLKQEWSIVLIGPIDKKEKILEIFTNLKNVYFLGRKPLELLPNYLKAFDVCVNPFKLNGLTEKVNPLKVYEYLAAGKPVVSIDMPEIRFLDSVIRIAKNRSQFIQYIEESLQESSLDKINDRQEKIKNFSWETLFSETTNKIAEYL